MSNLGAYQEFTTIAKKYGGVENLINLIKSESVKKGIKQGVQKGIVIGQKSGLAKGSAIGAIVTLAIGGVFFIVSKLQSKDTVDENAPKSNEPTPLNDFKPIYGPFHFYEETTIEGENITTEDAFWVAASDDDVILIFFPNIKDHPIYLGKDYLLENTDFKEIEIPEFE